MCFCLVLSRLVSSRLVYSLHTVCVALMQWCDRTGAEYGVHRDDRLRSPPECTGAGETGRCRGSHHAFRQHDHTALFRVSYNLIEWNFISVAMLKAEYIYSNYIGRIDMVIVEILWKFKIESLSCKIRCFPLIQSSHLFDEK